MKRDHLIIALLFVLVLSACSSRRRGKGCDCPTFGEVEMESTQTTATTLIRV
ncbi:MAG: hypothetical protein K9G41_05805 [Flavobacteriales bacterium]|nr:hypothetical protein [Flavobacteriales bacterium]